MYVTFRRTSLLTRDFFKRLVPYRDKASPTPEADDDDDTAFFSFMRKRTKLPDISDRQTISNCTVLFLVCDRLFLLKEDLSQWSFQKSQEPEAMKAYRKQLLKDIELLRSRKSSSQSTPARDAAELVDVLAEQREYHNSNCVPMFEVLLSVHCDDIDKILVHKGREPSVDIRCYGSHQICLVFTGDMERQMFIDQVFAIKQRLEEGGGVSYDAEDDSSQHQVFGSNKKNPMRQDDADTSQGEESESEEEPMDQAIYD